MREPASDPRTRVLIVEDDLSILTGLSMLLRYQGFEVLHAQDGRTGLQQAIDASPDIMVLDLMIPQMNGFEVLEELRRRALGIPVVVLSARSSEGDRVMGLNLGADDYVVKPFAVAELVARLRAVLRRRRRELESVPFGDSVIDLHAKIVARAGQPVLLTAQEFKLLAHFATHPGRTFNRDELLSAAWGYGYEGTARTVDNFVSQLRSKFELDPYKPRHFITVRGLGYRFDA